MHTIVFWFARLYVLYIQFKYLGTVFRTIRQTMAAGYDAATRYQRADETLGLCLFEEAANMEMSIRSKRDLRYWEFIVLTQLGIESVNNLVAAGWSRDRVRRQVTRIVQKAFEANRPQKPV